MTDTKALEKSVERYHRHKRQQAVMRPFLQELERQLSWGARDALLFSDFVGLYALNGDKYQCFVVVSYFKCNAIAEGNSKEYDLVFSRGEAHAGLVATSMELVIPGLLAKGLRKVIRSGDNGSNLFGYQMVFWASCVWSEWRIEYEDLSLCPRHAESEADRKGNTVKDRAWRTQVETGLSFTCVKDYANLFRGESNTRVHVISDPVPRTYTTPRFPIQSQVGTPNLGIVDGVSLLGVQSCCKVTYKYTDANGSEAHQPGIAIAMETPQSGTKFLWDIRERAPAKCLACSQRCLRPVKNVSPSAHHRDPCPRASNPALSRR